MTQKFHLFAIIVYYSRPRRAIAALRTKNEWKCAIKIVH